MISKKLISIAFKFAVTILILSACSEDSNLPLPDEMEKGASVSISRTVTSDSTINVYNFSDLNLEFDLSILFESDVASVDLMVVYGTYLYLGTDTYPTFNGDFQNPGILTSVSNFPTTVNVNIGDIINALDAINDTLDLIGGDAFTFYVNVTTSDGSFYPGYLPTGESTQSSSQSSIVGQNFNVIVPIICPFIRDVFIGTYNVKQEYDGTVNEYMATVEANPTDPLGLIVNDIWMAPSTTYITIDPLTYELKGEDQFITDWELADYGRIVMTNFNNGYANTCDLILFWKATPELEYISIWWITCDFTLTRIGD